MEQFTLRSSFRKQNSENRYKTLFNAIPHQLKTNTVVQAQSRIQSSSEAISLANCMTENSVGILELPVGVVSNLCVNDVFFHVPIATEESSVCAAASFGAKIAKSFTASCDAPIQDVHIAFKDVTIEGEGKFKVQMPEIINKFMVVLSSMHKRGGGLRGISYYRCEPNLFIVLVQVDVQDAMGANVVNSAAENLAPEIEAVTGGARLASIVSNYTDIRLVRAECAISVGHINLNEDTARRIHLMCCWADNDVRRATTHNKGIMNGVSAFALTTGNDTRALEAAAHSHACIGGSYKPLSSFVYVEEERILRGKIEIPALFATVGGATAHPVAQWTRAVLGINYHKNITSHVLNKIAAALGLAQNLAALRVLVTEGIQAGHMPLHARHAATYHATKSENGKT